MYFKCFQITKENYQIELLMRTFFLPSLFALCQHPCTLCTVFFFKSPCYCTSLPLPDGWSILLQHPVPVSFKPPRPSSRHGLSPARTSTYQRRPVCLSPRPDTEDVPAWGLSRGAARAQAALPFRGEQKHIIR